MKRNMIMHPALTLALAIIVMSVVSAPVYARGSEDGTNETDNISTRTATTEDPDKAVTTNITSQTTSEDSSAKKQAAEQKKAEIQKRRQDAEDQAKAKVAEKQQEAQTRLDAKKLEVCQKREEKVQNIMQRAGERGDRQIATFTKIAERTEAFYTKKGVTLANYDELVAQVVATKAAAEAQVAATKAIAVDFSCDSESPLGTAGAFKESIEAQKAAMKAFKTAVKNLIVGVKSVVSTTSDSATGNATTNTTETN